MFRTIITGIQAIVTKRGVVGYSAVSIGKIVAMCQSIKSDYSPMDAVYNCLANNTASYPRRLKSPLRRSHNAEIPNACCRITTVNP